MFSLKGVCKNNKIYLDEPLLIKKKCQVVVTFLDDPKKRGKDDENKSLNKK